MSPEVTCLEAALRADYDLYLEPAGVAWPGPLQLAALLALYANFGAAMSQQEIAAWMVEHSVGDYKFQLRHIAAKGWWIATGNKRTKHMQLDLALGRDQLRLVSTQDPNPFWCAAPVTIAEKSWTELLDHFALQKRGCAVCGLPAPAYDRGHLDPSKEGNAGSIVPMCPSCNNWAQARDAAFDFDPRTLVARPIMLTLAERRRIGG